MKNIDYLEITVRLLENYTSKHLQENAALVQDTIEAMKQEYTCELIQDNSFDTGLYYITSCCKRGPIVDENYCPYCGRKINK